MTREYIVCMVIYLSIGQFGCYLYLKMHMFFSFFFLQDGLSTCLLASPRNTFRWLTTVIIIVRAATDNTVNVRRAGFWMTSFLQADAVSSVNGAKNPKNVTYLTRRTVGYCTVKNATETGHNVTKVLYSTGI